MPPKPGTLALGQRVRQPKSGEGVILDTEVRRTQARVQVNFTETGAKRLVAA